VHQGGNDRSAIFAFVAFGEIGGVAVAGNRLAGGSTFLSHPLFAIRT